MCGTGDIRRCGAVIRQLLPSVVCVRVRGGGEGGALGDICTRAHDQIMIRTKVAASSLQNEKQNCQRDASHFKRRHSSIYPLWFCCSRKMKLPRLVPTSATENNVCGLHIVGAVVHSVRVFAGAVPSVEFMRSAQRAHTTQSWQTTSCGAAINIVTATKQRPVGPATNSNTRGAVAFHLRAAPQSSGAAPSGNVARVASEGAQTRVEY